MVSSYWHDVDHGDMCDCMLLALAVGAPPSSVDFAYCRNVLQKHWSVTCNHGCRGHAPRATPVLPHFDIHDPVQAALLANVQMA